MNLLSKIKPPRFRLICITGLLLAITLICRQYINIYTRQENAQNTNVRYRHLLKQADDLMIENERYTNYIQQRAKVSPFNGKETYNFLSTILDSLSLKLISVNAFQIEVSGEYRNLIQFIRELELAHVTDHVLSIDFKVSTNKRYKTINCLIKQNQENEA